MVHQMPDSICPRDLTPIAEQGVLWLNTCLTVEAKKANSHSKKGWETFTIEVLRAVVNRSKNVEGIEERGIVFLLWGAPASKTCKAIKIDEVRTQAISFFLTVLNCCCRKST